MKDICDKGFESVLDELIAEELIIANSKFPMFHSAHEGYAVLLEEVEEMIECGNNISARMRNIWEHIKHNSNESYSEVYSLRTDVLLLVEEAVQVGAMAQKFIDSQVGKEKTE